MSRILNWHLVFGPGLLAAFVAAMLLFGVDKSCAQTPDPVTPGYQVCNTNDPGQTHCSFVPDSIATPLPVQPSYLYNNITGQTTTTVKSGVGVLHSITFNTPVATETVTVFDNTAGSGTKIATITVPASPVPVTLTYDVVFNTGLTLVTATASGDITVSSR